MLNVLVVSLLIPTGGFVQTSPPPAPRVSAITGAVDSMDSAQQLAAHAAAFDRADRRARMLIEQVRCAQHVATLRQRGVFGPIDSLGRRGQCTSTGGRLVGVFFDADTLFTAVSRLSAVDMATSTRHEEPLDTAAILAVAHASRAAQLRGVEAFRRVQRAFAPLAVRFDDESIEVWLVPGAVLTGRPLTVGGARGYVFSPDGRTLTREIDEFDAMRTFEVPDTGMVRISSAERRVPTTTELMVANVLSERRRSVAIEMRNGSAMLVANGPSAVWVHVPRRE